MSQSTLNHTPNNTQDYLNVFREMDKDNSGYLDVSRVKNYLKSQQLPDDGLIDLASHSNQGHLTPEQFTAAMNLSHIKKTDDVECYNSSKFSSLLRHCEEAMKLFEQDPNMSSKDKLLDAFKALEDFMKYFLKDFEEKPQDTSSIGAAISSPKSMPGSFDFDERPQALSIGAGPIYLKKGLSNPHHDEKEPALLNSPSPLPQMNDATLMSGLKPIFKRHSSGEHFVPNRNYNNDSYRSNVLDSLRNATAIPDDSEFDSELSKERETLNDDYQEPYEDLVPTEIDKQSSIGVNNEPESTPTAPDFDSRPNSSFDSQWLNSSNKKAYVPEFFQGGLGGNSTEPYIKNANEAGVRPEGHPSFSADKQHEELSRENKPREEQNKTADTHASNSHFELPKIKEPDELDDKNKPFMQDRLANDSPESSVANETAILSKPKDQHSSTVEQEKLGNTPSGDDKDRGLGHSSENSSSLAHAASDKKSTASGLGSVLLKIGAEVTNAAGTTASNLLGYGDDKNKGTDDVSNSPSNDSNHKLASHNVYSPSLTSDYSVENTPKCSKPDVISSKALSDIANKVDAEINNDAILDNSINEDGVISSDALNKMADSLDSAIEENAAPTTNPSNELPEREVNVLVDRNTSLPPSIDKEVDIETTNNNSSRSPLVNNTITHDSLTPTKLSNNDSHSIASNDYNEGGSTVPDSPHASTHVSGNSSFSPASLSRNDSGEKSDVKDEEDGKPGFFSRLFGGMSKPSEPNSIQSSPNTTCDSNAARLDNAPEGSTSASADTSNVHAPPSPSNHSSDINDALDKISLEADNDKAHIDDSSNVDNIHDKSSSHSTNSRNTSNNPLFSKALDDLATSIDETKRNLDDTLSSPISYEPSSSLDSDSKGFPVGPIDADKRLDKSTDVPIDKSTNQNVNMDEVVDGSGFSSSLGKLSDGLKSLKSDIDGTIDSFTSSPAKSNDRSPDTYNAGNKSSVTATSDGDSNIPSIESNAKKSDAGYSNFDISKPDSATESNATNIDANVDGSGLSNSLEKLSAGIKSLNAEIDGVMATPALPSTNTNTNDAPKTDHSPVDVPPTSNDSDGDANNSTSAGLSATFGKLAAGIKGLKDGISEKLGSSADGSNAESKSSSIPGASFKDSNADTVNTESNVHLPLDTDTKDSSAIKKLDNANNSDKLSSFDGNHSFTGYDSKEPLADRKADMNVGRSGSSDSIEKLPGDFKGLEEDISNDKLPSLNDNSKNTKFNVDLDEPLKTAEVDNEPLSMNNDLNASMEDNDVDDNFIDMPGSFSRPRSSLIESTSTPNVDKELPSLDKSSKDDSSNKSKDLPNTVDINKDLPLLHDGVKNLNNIFKELPPIDSPRGAETTNSGGNKDNSKSSTHTPKLDYDAGINPTAGTGLPNPLDKLSNSLKSIRKDIAGTPDGSVGVHNIEGTYPSINAALDGPNILHRTDEKASDEKASGETANVISTSNLDRTPSIHEDLIVPQGNYDSRSNVDKLDSNMEKGHSSNMLKDNETMNNPNHGVDVSGIKSDNSGASFDENVSVLPVAPSHSAPQESLNTNNASDGSRRPLGEVVNNPTREKDYNQDSAPSRYAPLGTGSINENSNDLSDMLDDIVKKHSNNIPSEADTTRSGKKSFDQSNNLSNGHDEHHSSHADDESHSVVSDSRFKELVEKENDMADYSTPLDTPTAYNDYQNTFADTPSVAPSKVDSLESDVKKQLDAMSASVGQAPSIHKNKEQHSPSETRRSSGGLQSMFFHDRSAADAIKSVYDHMATKLKTSDNREDDAVLKVRDGFENFNGIGVKCVSDNQDKGK